jgi:hypothetical protein
MPTAGFHDLFEMILAENSFFLHAKIYKFASVTNYFKKIDYEQS